MASREAWPWLFADPRHLSEQKHPDTLDWAVLLCRHIDVTKLCILTKERIIEPSDSPFNGHSSILPPSTQALDKILSAYSQIGNALPRLTQYEDAFRGNHDFEHLLAFLFQNITEFHTKTLDLLRKPAWKIFFVSSWGRFESRFGAILDSINKTSTLIDQEASSLNIVIMKEWHTELLEKAEVAETRWQSQQFQALMKWLETSDKEHQSRYDWLRDRACEGTGGWIMNHTKFRACMRQGNSPTGILWMNGKPGSGKDWSILFFSKASLITMTIKSVLCSQVVKFLQMDKKRHVVFIFGTRQTHLSAYDIQTYILQAIVAQVIRLNNDMVPFLYDEYLAKAQLSSAAIRLVVDGVDELPTSEHKKIIKDLLELAKKSNGTLKLLFPSQDLPSIRPNDSMGSSRLFTPSLLNQHPGVARFYGQTLNNITARCSPAQLLMVKRIFVWLIFSKDGLRTKKTDFLIGSTIRPGTEELNRDSRPFPTSLDVCKPLIEDGPHGTVTIVHSTVTEHLLSPDSGPFINQTEAQHSLAYACVCQVSRNLDLAIAADHNKHLLDVCLGLFGLLDYTNEYWKLHLKDALHLGYNTQPTAVPEHQATLIQQINRLFKKYSSASSILGPTKTLSEISLELVGPAGTLSISNPQTTAQIPDLLTMVVQVQTLTTTATHVLEYSTTGATSGQESDSLPLERAETRYRDLVRQILLQPNQGLLPSEVMTFRQQYATSAYPCPHKDESCGYNDVGFPSKASLQAHVRKYHNQRTVRALPKSIRRSNTPSIPGQQAARPASNSRLKIEPPSTALRSDSAADTIANANGLESIHHLQSSKVKKKTISLPLASLGLSHEDYWSQMLRLESETKTRLRNARNENNSPTGQADDHMPSTESQNSQGQGSDKQPSSLDITEEEHHLPEARLVWVKHQGIRMPKAWGLRL
ncbi:hypothetical protein QBC38DRAFT_517185 [Podospora fimiseda]|uniref:NACHT domain-containing protein n=1 Tax=Podospora fimiseda TaxID=252190 RepID=A0AAN7BH64_9PEZI|nr:hypothetical protein QBC38DRAFT_517185 [Podospora fimiseda]